MKNEHFIILQIFKISEFGPLRFKSLFIKKNGQNDQIIGNPEIYVKQLITICLLFKLISFQFCSGNGHL